MAPQTVRYLTIDDLRELFHCGRSKASNIMYQLPHIIVGRRPMVCADALEEYLETHDGVIDVRWPARR
jgi:hypothetical protein